MSQTYNLDDFAPFGGKARYEYQEDALAILHDVSTLAINALDEIMFPKDDQGEWPSECQAYFAVQRTSGSEGNHDYFLMGGDGLLSCVDQIEAETPFSRDGADWGKCGDDLAFKVYSDPPCLLTFHELTPSGIDALRDEDGFISDVPSEAVEKVFDDQALIVPPAKTLWKVEYGVDDAITDLRFLPEAEFSPFAITCAVVENGVAVLESVGNGLFSIPADVLEGLKGDVRAVEFAGTSAPMASFTIPGWQYKGEQARWALAYEREYGVPPSFLDFLEYDKQLEKKVPDHGKRLSDKQANVKTASDRLDAEREPKANIPIHDEESK